MLEETAKSSCETKMMVAFKNFTNQWILVHEKCQRLAPVLSTRVHPFYTSLLIFKI